MSEYIMVAPWVRDTLLIVLEESPRWTVMDNGTASPRIVCAERKRWQKFLRGHV
jgi:hypothetical protein